MPKIRRLAGAVSSLIAAGEVIERPASLLKELIENALDAGASKISVEVLGAGKKSLRVVDNGYGMDQEDCALAFERHATSKISALSDLASLDTYGFRGEALFAMAAVSRSVIRSAVKGAKTGWQVSCEAGRIKSSSPAPAVTGTTVEVNDLFFNTPARFKFLKSDAYEKAALVAVVEEAALANPSVAFSYKSEGRQALNFAAEKSQDALESFQRRLSAVLGAEISSNLVPVLADRPEMRLWLFLSPADGLIASRDLQYWFVNRRPIASRTLQQALYRAYQEVRGGRHPVCVAHLELPPSSFDVNVHPGKREIRFKSDREMHDLVFGLAHQALAKSKTAAPIFLPAPGGESQVKEEVPGYYLGGRSLFPQEVAPMLKFTAERASQALSAPSSAPRWFTPPFRYLGQIERSYLVFEAAGGLFVMDQHAAAERILYEKFLAEIENGSPKTQPLMLPLPIELPASRLQKVLSQAGRLSKLGFEIAPFGKTTLHVTAAPALFSAAGDLKELVHRLLDSLEHAGATARDVKHEAVSTIACKAAVKAHDALSPQEALKLLDDLKDCQDGSACPHGRRAILALNREELAQRFQRPGAPPL